MNERFENLTAGVSGIYKSIQRIKRLRMTALGLKGAHVMCIYYLSEHPQGMTAAELSRICQEDKAATSRILAELENLGLVKSETPSKARKYRSHITLTAAGKMSAEKIRPLILQATLAGGQDITEEERKIFYRVLFRIAENLEEVCRTITTKG